MLILTLKNNYRAFGVFDGHGKNGDIIAQFTADNLVKCIKKQIDNMNAKGKIWIYSWLYIKFLDPKITIDIFEQVQNDIKNQIIKKGFEDLSNLLEQEEYDSEKSGTTANVVLICKNIMTCINVGDSRAMLGTFHNFTKTWKPIVLSRDHKPDIKTEHDRIEAAGGYVHFQKNSAGIRVNLNCSNILYL